VRVELDEVREAWRKVRRGGKSAGPDGLTLPEFKRHAESHLENLCWELRRGVYVPGGYRSVTIPKPLSGTRTICVGNVRDRVAQRVLHDRLMPYVEAISLPASFAYRPGLDYRRALQAVARHRDSGFTVVLNADVEKCFDRIRLEIVEELLAELNLDPELLQLVLESVASGRGPGMRVPGGLPQGAVLSPLLCNLVLTELDRAVSGRHVRMVRYADDFVVLARSARGCERASDRVGYALWNVGLRMNEKKSELTDFKRGFHFLGAEIVGSYIVAQQPAPYQRRRRGRKQARKLAYVF